MNNSSYSSGAPTDCVFGEMSAASKAVLTLVYILVAIVALLGNSAIIQIVLRKHRIRKVAFNFFIISMAIADILDALFAVPISVASLYKWSRWFGGLLGQMTCKVFHFLSALSWAASVITLTAISVERYVAIVHNLRKPPSTSTRRVKIVIALLWIFTSASMVPYLYRYKVVNYWDEWHCYGQWVADPKENDKINQYEIVIKFIIFYVLPLVIMTVLYSLVICVLKKRQAFGENVSQVRIQRQNKMVVKMLVTVLVIFALCWLPMNIAILLLAFNSNKLSCMPFSAIVWVFWPPHANGAINPCIYLIFSESFRKGLKELLMSCRRNKATGPWQPEIKKRFSDKDVFRAGIKGHFREISRGKTTDSDEVFDTRL